MMDYDLVPLPRLLKDDLSVDAYLHPVSESVTLSATPLSYCSMQLLPEETLEALRYVEVFTCNGSAGIFRVRSTSTAYGQDTSSAELEHAITEIGDYLVKEQTEDVEISLPDAITRAFSYYTGSLWQLGDLTALGTGTFKFSFSYERILDVILTLMQRKPDCYLTFDFDTTPWTVSVAQYDTAVTAQGRLTRNVTSASVDVDTTDLCTVVYYETKTGSGSSAISSWQSISDPTALAQYGRIERVLPSGDDDTNDIIEAKAQEHLRVYKKPRIGVSVTGEILSQVTGESMDAIAIGKRYRLDLTGYGIDYAEENVSQMVWQDVYGHPYGVQITLAQETETAVDYIHQIDANGGTVSGGQQRR